MVIENQVPAGSRDRDVKAWQFSETFVCENDLLWKIVVFWFIRQKRAPPVER
jgi:hypothetical protein